MKRTQLCLSCILLMLFIAFFSSPLLSQTPYLQWSVSYGGAEDDYPCEIEVLEDGYLIGGYTKSFGNQNDKYDFYLVRTDNMGNIIWSKTYGGSQNENMASLSQAHDGGYILSGVTQSWGEGGSDGYMVRVDKNGDTLWTKYYGGLTWDQFYSGIPTRDRGFVFTGFSSVYLKGDQVYIVKTDVNGDTLWTQTEGGDHQDYGYCILEDITSGYASLGHTWSQGNESMGYLVRLNNSGHVTWWNAFGDTGEEYCRWFDQNEDHSFTIVGSTQSFGHGMDDFWLVYTNTDGTPTHWFTYGGGGADIPYSGSRDVDGGILMAGHTWSFGLQEPNIFFMKTNADGDSLWALDWGDQDWEYAWDIKPTLDGGYVVLGRDYSISSGDNDIVLLKYGPNPSLFNTLQHHHNLDLPIEDDQTTVDDIFIDGSLTGTVTGLAVYIDTIVHGEIKDLVITLSHDGVTDTLMAAPPGGGMNMYNTIFHPAASCDAQAGVSPMSGMYRPCRATTVFSGTAVAGPWSLQVHDTQAGNTGTLKAWGIQVYYEEEVDVQEWNGADLYTTEMHLFPNPAKHVVRCRINSEVPEEVYAGCSLYIYDACGRCVNGHELPDGRKETTIDVSGLGEGVYFLSLLAGEKLLAKEKLVILR